MTKPKIVIADDEIDILNLLTILFKSRDFEVFGASDGQSALDTILKEKPNVAVLDFMMPHMDGISVCEEVRKTHPDIFMIIMSGVDSERLRKQSQNVKVDQYVEKPLRMNKLVEIIQTGLAERAETVVLDKIQG